MIEIILPKENLIEVCFIDSLKNVILSCLNMVQCFVLASYWIKPVIIHDLFIYVLAVYPAHYLSGCCHVPIARAFLFLLVS